MRLGAVKIAVAGVLLLLACGAPAARADFGIANFEALTWSNGRAEPTSTPIGKTRTWQTCTPTAKRVGAATSGICSRGWRICGRC